MWKKKHYIKYLYAEKKNPNNLETQVEEDITEEARGQSLSKCKVEQAIK